MTTPAPSAEGGRLREVVERVATQLKADADLSRPYGTRRMAVQTLDAYAAELLKALRGAQ